MVLTYYAKSVRNFLHEVAAVLPGKNKYIYATLDVHQDCGVFFFHYLDIILLLLVLIAAFPVEVIWLVKFKSITVEFLLWISWRTCACTCTAGLSSNLEGYSLHSIHVAIKN